MAVVEEDQPDMVLGLVAAVGQHAMVVMLEEGEAEMKGSRRSTTFIR